MIKQKVIIYVIEDEKLLVFRHKDFSYEEVGIQVPAGTVEDNESLENAALRELVEETGYNYFNIVSSLGKDTYNISPYRDEIQERHFFLAEVNAPLSERWDTKEGDINFEFFWVPLKNAHVLQAGQGSMIWKVI